MSTERTIQVEVSDEVAEYIHRQVETGGFADEGAVVTHALEGAVEIEAEVERWLRDEVKPTLERIEREGSRGLSAEEVRIELDRRRRARRASAA
jgi:Arc/MetJ-type ribon-helix-helix transcriptional regulator